jgi:hypothetical protein
MLNISRQIYAAVDTKQTKYDLPEAEVLPGGDTANEKKRLEKITAKYGSAAEHENVPLPGFTLYKSDRKRWGSLDQTWLVIDPRGFLVRITSENLEKILHVTGITEGLIQERCVWAREDSQTKLTLVPVTSANFKVAVSNTELLEGKVSIKEVSIGDKVIMQNGLAGTYYGIASLYGAIEDYSRDDRHKTQVYLRRQIIEITPGKFFYHSDAKILKVTEKTDKEYTREDAAKYMNEHIKAGTAFFGSNAYSLQHGKYYSHRNRIDFVSVNAVPKPTLSLIEIDESEANDIFIECQASTDSYKLVLERSNKLYVVDFPYSYSAVPASILGFDVSSITLSVDKQSIVHTQKRTYSSSRAASRSESLDKFTKFYKIAKHVKNDFYV